jgi:hypothetical protein
VAATDVLFFRHYADMSVQFVAAEQRAAANRLLQSQLAQPAPTSEPTEAAGEPGVETNDTQIAGRATAPRIWVSTVSKTETEDNQIGNAGHGS